MKLLAEKLRAEARRLVKTATNSPETQLKNELSERALRLSVRAEAIANSMDAPAIIEMNIRRYQHMLAGGPMSLTEKPSMRCSPTPKHCWLTFTGGDTYPQVRSERPMTTYQCCFLGEDNQPVRTQILAARDELEARREAMNLMMRVGRFSGYELWAQGGVIAEYRSVKESSTSGR